ncbi:hypothetical protein RSJ42_04735 [Methanosarcina hadiensis]|uniref:hypothetical protein n=1 Tax=Methanosarcina hadiensis TaxID=3078083 RepID=UPI00397771F6
MGEAALLHRINENNSPLKRLYASGNTILKRLSLKGLLSSNGIENLRQLAWRLCTKRRKNKEEQ